jgi:hypothetical protein
MHYIFINNKSANPQVSLQHREVGVKAYVLLYRTTTPDAKPSHYTCPSFHATTKEAIG